MNSQTADTASTVRSIKTERALVLDREEIRNTKKGYRIIKRVADIILSAIAIIILFPFLLIISLIIYIDSPVASPIFVQTRVGLDGKEFRFFKFRSMVPNAEAKLEELMSQNEMSGPAFKMKNDPRVTRVGKFIRRTSIDELPQLLNILLGQMSFVGPRPPLPNEVAQYDEYAKQRLYVVPGLTCYWQIQPDHNDIGFDDWLELDIKYIRRRSIMTDICIIFRTFAVVFRMDGR